MKQSSDQYHGRFFLLDLSKHGFFLRERREPREVKYFSVCLRRAAGEGMKNLDKRRSGVSAWPTRPYGLADRAKTLLHNNGNGRVPFFIMEIQRPVTQNS